MELTALIILIATVAVALVGYGFTHRSNILLAQRQARLSRVNEQLNEFYGPLLALTTSTDIAWRAFFDSAHPRGEPFWLGNNPREEEQQPFRLWMTEVFMPANERLEQIIVSRADLLEDKEMPDVLLVPVAHVAGYRILLERWKQGDYTEHRSVVDFPGDEIRAYATGMFSRLKAVQNDLLGLTQSR